MTIDEAITRYEETADNLEKCADRIDELKCDSTTTRQSEEFHRQLADWLRELKAYREIITNAPQIVTEKYGSDIIEGYADIYDMLREVQNESKSNRD